VFGNDQGLAGFLNFIDQGQALRFKFCGGDFHMTSMNDQSYMSRDVRGEDFRTGGRPTIDED
jgi:hypothetical protein